MRETVCRHCRKEISKTGKYWGDAEGNILCGMCDCGKPFGHEPAPAEPLYSTQEMKDEGLKATETDYGKEGTATMYSKGEPPRTFDMNKCATHGVTMESCAKDKRTGCKSMAASPEGPRQKLEAANELDGFLSEHRNVFDLLFNQQISVKKAIEALACYRAGNIPALPEVVDEQ